mmetsp:Transcript_120041/g.334887  ORF Transcript_120041/g.334887 Transcript_120041/m.334887 type:complete len:215 (-) Transcript_120041:616-1260(-)
MSANSFSRDGRPLTTCFSQSALTSSRCVSSPLSVASSAGARKRPRMHASEPSITFLAMREKYSRQHCTLRSLHWELPPPNLKRSSRCISSKDTSIMPAIWLRKPAKQIHSFRVHSSKEVTEAKCRTVIFTSSASRPNHTNATHRQPRDTQSKMVLAMSGHSLLRAVLAVALPASSSCSSPSAPWRPHTTCEMICRCTIHSFFNASDMRRAKLAY